MALEEVGIRLLAEDANKFERDMKDSQQVFLAFIGTLERGAKDIDGSMGAGERAINDFADESVAAFNRVDGASEVIIGAFRRVGEMAVNALFSAGEALIGFGMDSIGVAADYETTLNKFGSVTGDAMADAGMSVDDFNDLFLQMGADTPFSAQQAADAAVNLAKGGLTPATIAAGGLEAALNLASVGELELAASGEILAKQLAVWGDKGVTAVEVTDLLARAANASTVDVDNLANGIANVQGRAVAMGVGYGELIQTLALIAPGFDSTTTAGTSLNNFFARLLPATDGAKDAMKDLGLFTDATGSAFFDANGQFVGMPDAIGLLSAAMKDLSEEEKSLALNTIFGNDAAGAASALIEKGLPGYNAMGEAITSQGTAAEQAKDKQKGWNVAIDALMGSIETGRIGTVMPFLDSLSSYVDRVTEAVNATFAWAASIATAEDPLAALVGSIDSAIPGFASFIDTIAGIPAKVIEISTAFQEDFAPEIQLAKDIFETAMIVIEKIVDSVVDTVTRAIAGFQSDMATSFAGGGEVLAAFSRLWEALEPIVMGVLQVLGAAFLVFLGVVTGIFSGIMSAAEPFLSGLILVLDSISLALGGLAQFVEGFVNLFVSLIQGNSEGVKDAFSDMDQGLRDIIFGMTAAILATLKTFVDAGLAFIGGFVWGIIEFFVQLYEDLVGHSIIPDMVNGILDWFNDLAVRGLVFVTGLVDDIKSLFTDTDWMALGKGIVDGIINGITSLAGNLATAARDAASAAYTAVTDFLGMESPSKLFMEVGEMTMAGFTVGIEDGEAGAAATMEGVFRGLTLDALEPVTSPAVSPISSPVSNITNVYNDNSTHAGENYNLNVRTPESAGTVGNTIRSLQSIGRIRGGG